MRLRTRRLKMPTIYSYPRIEPGRKVFPRAGQIFWTIMQVYNAGFTSHNVWVFMVNGKTAWKVIRADTISDANNYSIWAFDEDTTLVDYWNDCDRGQDSSRMHTAITKSHLNDMIIRSGVPSDEHYIT